MKRIYVIISLMISSAFFFVSCSEDATTELGWINSSPAEINDILWTDGTTADTEWSKDGGYEVDAQTESKEVDLLTGDVECALNTGDEFEEASVVIGDTAQGSLVLDEGESYVYSITASAKKK